MIYKLVQTDFVLGWGWRGMMLVDVACAAVRLGDKVLAG